MLCVTFWLTGANCFKSSIRYRGPEPVRWIPLLLSPPLRCPFKLLLLLLHTVTSISFDNKFHFMHALNANPWREKDPSAFIIQHYRAYIFKFGPVVDKTEVHAVAPSLGIWRNEMIIIFENKIFLASGQSATDRSIDRPRETCPHPSMHPAIGSVIENPRSNLSLIIAFFHFLSQPAHRRSPIVLRTNVTLLRKALLSIVYGSPWRKPKKDHRGEGINWRPSAPSESGFLPLLSRGEWGNCTCKGKANLSC